MIEEATPSEEARYTILCVDDEVNILATLRRLLRKHGYEVLTAESAQGGLRELEEKSVDLVISDMRMPEMDGAAFLQIVRQRWPDTVRLLLTGFADIPSILSAINNGEIYRYLTKPWEEQELLLILRRALERVALERDKRRLEGLVLRQNEELRLLNVELESKVLARTEALDVANAKLKKNYLNSIKVFSNLMDLRGGNLRGHSRILADLARRTAVNMQLDEATQQEIFVAGLLHDVGKIGLSDGILMCPVGRLSKEDMSMYMRHPAWGEMALISQDDMQGVAALIRGHHERYDGQGFPDGLRGSMLPIATHILIVAEAYLDMQEGNLSKAKLSASEACALLARGRGTQFHPEVVDVFLQVALNAVPADSSPYRMLPTSELLPGMVVAKDLLAQESIVLLGNDHVLTDKLIRLLRLREVRDGVTFMLAVKLEAKP
jgi:response regulator RpfG family c-di-GMP phosphodiesterase